MHFFAYLRDGAAPVPAGDFWDWILSPSIQEISFRALVVIFVIALLTGQIVPKRVAEEYRKAAEKQAITNDKLVDQNSKLLAGIRIADHFYAEFLSNDSPQKKGEAPDVGT